MPVEVILPKVDMDMTHGTLAVWHVAEGEGVSKGAALFDIETEKAAMEVEAPATGILHHISAKPGEKVAVGTVVAMIYAEGEAVGPKPVSAPQVVEAEAQATAPSHPQPAPETLSTSGPTTGIRATPAARAAARTAGQSLADVVGSGPRGRIQRSDIRQKSVGSDLPAPTVWVPQVGPLHISRRKGRGVPIVMIHGFTADSHSWAPLEKALGPDRALIRIDLPGHGKSPHRHIAGFADLARMMAEAFDTVTDGPVHLLGHSLGGALALALADIRARNIASLTMIAPAGLGPEIDAATLSGIVRASRIESLLPWLRRLTATPQAIGEDYARAAMRSRNDPALRAVQADMAAALFPDGVQAFDLSAALSRLTLPTCMIWGRGDKILPYRQAFATPGDAALHLLQGAGHVPHIEIPDRVARIIARHADLPL